jgi:hypothetical protein
MDPEWRIVIELVLETSAVELEASLASELPVEAAVSRAGRLVFLYARERQIAELAHELTRAHARRHQVASEPKLERWNPGSSGWQDPELPVDPLPVEDEVTVDDIDALSWEVRVQSHDAAALRRLATGLDAEGALLLARGRHRLRIGAEDDESATAIAERARLELPIGSTIDLEPLSLLHRLLARETAHRRNHVSGAGGDFAGPR